MKTNFLKTALVVGIAFFFANCSSDDSSSTPTFKSENFLQGYLKSTGFNQEVSDINNSEVNFEMGLHFSPLVNGSITAIRVKLPMANPELRVTFWDKATKKAIRTETVNVAKANTEYTFDMAKLVLTKDTEYAISYNGDGWYERYQTDLLEANYPVTAGNIKILNYAYISGPSQKFPASVMLTYYAGDLSFDFTQSN